MKIVINITLPKNFFVIHVDVVFVIFRCTVGTCSMEFNLFIVDERKLEFIVDTDLIVNILRIVREGIG